MKIQLSDHFTYKKLLRFTLPSIVMMIFTSIYGMVDGFFVSNFAGETAFTAVSRTRLQTIAEGRERKRAKRAKQALWVCERFDKTLTTILIGNNVFHASCATLSKRRKMTNSPPSGIWMPRSMRSGNWRKRCPNCPPGNPSNPMILFGIGWKRCTALKCWRRCWKSRISC